MLFTEANVVLPATILRCHGSPAARLATIARFWGPACAGNLAGTFVVGYAKQVQGGQVGQDAVRAAVTATVV